MLTGSGAVREKLAGRLMLFGRMILVVWLLATAAWLQKLDSADLSEDVQDLGVLAALDDVPPAAELRRLPDRAFTNAVDWLARTHADVTEAHVRARTNLVAWLDAQGVSRNQLSRLSGKDSAPVESALPFHLIQIEGAQAVRWEVGGPPQFPMLSDPRFDAGRDDAANGLTVSAYLTALDELAGATSLKCVVEIDEQALRSERIAAGPQAIFNLVEHTSRGPGPPPLGPPGAPQFPSLPPLHGNPPIVGPDGMPLSVPGPEWTPGSPMLPPPLRVEGQMRPHMRDVPVLMSASLEGDRVRLIYRVDGADEGPNPIQAPLASRERSTTLPVTTTTIRAPSLLVLSDPERAENRTFERMYLAGERKANLGRTYGHLPLTEAISLANEGLTQAYRSVSLFGFTFSTRRFPLAVLAFMAAALLGSLSTLRIAARRGVPLMRELADAHGLEMSAGRLPARLALWMALPLVALWASQPVVPLSSFETAALYVGAGVIALVGLECTRLSARLDAEQPPVGAASGSLRSREAA